MAGTSKEQFAAFGFVQFFASVHIFTYHLWQQTKYLGHRDYMYWGPGWVACFFVLSGFKLTYSQLRKKDPSKIDPFVPYMWRRLMRLLPIYYLSLFMTFLLKQYRGDAQPLWINLPFNLTLTFTWIGSVAGGWHAGWHGTHWYMGDLLLHQICWRWTYPLVTRLPNLACLGLLVVCMLITLLRCLLIQWKYAEQQTTYWPVYTFNQFVCGMLLAKLYVSRPSPVGGRPVDRLALTVHGHRVPLSGLGCFLLVLAIIHNVSHKLMYTYLSNSIWSGVLLPVYVLMVWCICLEDGPLDWLCQRRPFCWMGEVSYGVYIFHWNTLMITRAYGERFLPMHWSEDVRFWCILCPATVLFSALVAFCFDRPIQAWGASFLRRALASREAHAKSS